MRINSSDLENAVKRLNTLTGSPETYMTDGKSNVGHYHLSWAYGGVCLHRLASEWGAVNQVFGGGYGTKRELFEKINAFISGIEYSQEDPK